MGMGSGGSKGGGYAQPQQTQSQMGGLGGKGKGGAQQQFQQPIQQSVYQSPVQQNPYAQSYYQPQFRPQTFNNPFAQGGFGQQMGGMDQPQVQQPQPQPQPQVQQPQGGMGGKGGAIQQFLQQRQQQQGGMGGKGGNINQVGPDDRPLGGMGGKGGGMGLGGAYNLNSPAAQQFQAANPQSQTPSPEMARMFEKMNSDTSVARNQLEGTDFGRQRMAEMHQNAMRQGPSFRGYGNMLAGQPQTQSQLRGLAALQQPTATTQAATPAPEQPYMGNYLS